MLLTIYLSSSSDQPFSLIKLFNLQQANQDLKAEEGANDVRNGSRRLETGFNE